MKYLLVIILMLLSIASFSQQKIGADGAMHPTGNYQSVNMREIKGLSLSVQSIIDRNNLPNYYRDTGMLVYVRDSSSFYTLVGGFTNSNWQRATPTTVLQDLNSVAHVGNFTDTSIILRGQSYLNVNISDTSTGNYASIGIDNVGLPNITLGDTLFKSAILANHTADRTFVLPDSNGIGTIAGRINGITYATNPQGVLDFGNISLGSDTSIVLDSSNITVFVDSTVLTPPATHAEGQKVLVGYGATGDFATRQGWIADWDDIASDWVYTDPSTFDVGTYLSDANENDPHTMQWDGSIWIRRLTLLPNGGLKIKQPVLLATKDKYAVIIKANNQEGLRVRTDRNVSLAKWKGFQSNNYLAIDSSTGNIVPHILDTLKVTNIGSTFYYNGDSLNIPVSSGGGSNTDDLDSVLNRQTDPMQFDHTVDFGGHSLALSNSSSIVLSSTQGEVNTYTQVGLDSTSGGVIVANDTSNASVTASKIAEQLASGLSSSRTGGELPDNSHEMIVYPDSIVFKPLTDDIKIIVEGLDSSDADPNNVAWFDENNILHRGHLSTSGGGTTFDQSLINQGSTPMTSDPVIDWDGHSFEWDNLEHFSISNANDDYDISLNPLGGGIIMNANDNDNNEGASLSLNTGKGSLSAIDADTSTLIEISGNLVRIASENTLVGDKPVNLQINLDSSDADPINMLGLDENGMMHKYAVPNGGTTPNLQEVVDVGSTASLHGTNGLTIDSAAYWYLQGHATEHTFIGDVGNGIGIQSTSLDFTNTSNFNINHSKVLAAPNDSFEVKPQGDDVAKFVVTKDNVIIRTDSTNSPVAMLGVDESNNVHKYATSGNKFGVNDTSSSGYRHFNPGLDTFSFDKDIYISGKRIGRGNGGVLYNTLFGKASLMNNTTGSQNVAIGDSVLYFNTTGNNSVGIGFSALKNNSSFGYSTAIGAYALMTNTTGYYNNAVGYKSMTSNISGQQNDAFGANTLYSNTTGNYNTAVGYKALYNNTTGSTNVAVGNSALLANTTGIENTAIGVNVMPANTTGHDNAALGYWTMLSNTTGVENTAFGTTAMRFNTTGNGNVALGRYALHNNDTGSYNVAAGYYAFDNLHGNYNIGLGYFAAASLLNSDSTLYISDATTKMKYNLNQSTDEPVKMVGVDGSGFWHQYAVPSGGGGSSNTDNLDSVLTRQGSNPLENMVNIDVGSNLFLLTNTSAFSVTTSGSPVFSQLNVSPTELTLNHANMGTNSYIELAGDSTTIKGGASTIHDSSWNNKLIVKGNKLIFISNVGVDKKDTVINILANLDSATGTAPSVIGKDADGYWHAYKKVLAVTLYSRFTPSDGETINAVVNKNNYIEPASSLSALTINLPSSPEDGDWVGFSFSQDITTLTFSGGTLTNNVTTTNAGGVVKFQFISATNKWSKMP